MEAEYIVNNSSTIRKTAEHFCLSKSTIHKDLRIRLPKVSYDLSQKVDELLLFNEAIGHIRGGESTKRKFKK